jgi:ribosomal protein L37E
VCTALLNAATALGATQAVVGPRGDRAYPVPKRLYQSLGFATIDRTQTYTWTSHDTSRRPIPER